MKRILIVALTAALAAAALVGAVDFVVEPASPASGGDMPTYDATMELKWDNGTHRWSIAWYSGAGSCVGNDFNLSTISAYRAVGKVRFYSRDDWPNAQWDGFRVGIYNFSAVPGSLLWPTAGGGYLFKPTGLHGHIWVDIPVGWTCSSTAFASARFRLGIIGRGARRARLPLRRVRRLGLRGQVGLVWVWQRPIRMPRGFSIHEGRHPGLRSRLQ
jgi:hypothetical protein